MVEAAKQALNEQFDRQVNDFYKNAKAKAECKNIKMQKCKKKREKIKEKKT